MKTKIPFTILIIMLISLSFMASVQSQTLTQTKGGRNIQASEIARGKPSNQKPTQGIATGTVSTLEKGKTKWALIIGISNYDGTANDLDYCDDDAVDFRDALIYTYHWDEKHIQLLTDEAATKTNILLAIDWLRTNEQAGDEVVFFYSGHGSISNYDADNDGEKKDECILPSNFQAEGVIWDGQLKQEFLAFASERIMFFFDSCYSGGMTDLVAPGRLVLMACGENQLSLESSAWQNGQFTYYFVTKGIIAGQADKDNNGVTFEEAFDYAKANCQRQTPIASDNFEYDMLP
jgi:hypothetical protein